MSSFILLSSRPPLPPSRSPSLPPIPSSLPSLRAGFSIDGPSEAKIDCKDNNDGSAEVAYWPTAPGEYAVHILCDDEDIPKSPYMAQIVPQSREFDPSKVKAYGPGIEPDGARLNEPAEFTVDTRGEASQQTGGEGIPKAGLWAVLR